MATHRSSKVTEIEDEVVEEAGTNEKTNTSPKKPD